MYLLYLLWSLSLLSPTPKPSLIIFLALDWRTVLGCKEHTIHAAPPPSCQECTQLPWFYTTSLIPGAPTEFFSHILANFHISNFFSCCFPIWKALTICLSIYSPSTTKRSLIRWILPLLIISICHNLSIFIYIIY